MLQEIIISRDLAEKIMQEGLRESQKDMEATGFCSGYHDRNQIYVTNVYPLCSQEGIDNWISGIRDLFRKLISFPKALHVFLQLEKHQRDLAEQGKIAAEMAYHTHPHGTWSVRDVNNTLRYQRSNNKRRVKTASILYRIDTDSFEVIDGKGSVMSVSIA